ncbi:ROK family protein [Pedobacter sp. MC2016-05]|uniref:ROK family protein n=1 Tax=Pedobacter sp. MC2016-05 TaxID=2994474 RepID=UPI002246FCBB|nr:ROK family protein [Pedobacter sp. MC2016-05]MCX2477009.1 ROK family protein [Pedobacter sp. MC2016-05]
MIALDNEQYAVGIDVGGSSLKCGLIDSVGKIHYSTLVSLREVNTEQGVIIKIAQSILDCAAKVPSILGVGIGFPGIIENNCVIGGADNLPGFNNLPLGSILSDATGFRNIKIANDANLMGLGEQKFGAAMQASDVLFLTVGTGIGGAIMIANQLYGGFRNRGSEIGHIVVQQDGLPCACGGKGCLEAYASVTSLVNYFKQNSQASADVDGEYIIKHYLQGDHLAKQAMKRHFDYLASGIVGLVNIFSPQKVVVGGGISEAGPFYINEIEMRVRSLAIPIAVANTSFAVAELGNKAGMLGCAAIIFEDLAMK